MRKAAKVLEKRMASRPASLNVTASAGAPAGGAAEGKVRILAGTPVVLELMESVASRHVPRWATIHFQLAEDVRVEGHLVLARGRAVEGIATEVRTPRPFGGPGYFSIEVAGLHADDGSTIRLTGLVYPAKASSP